MRTIIPLSSNVSSRVISLRGLLPLMILAGAWSAAQMMTAQAPASTAPGSSFQQKSASHKRSVKTKKNSATAEAAPAPVTPPAPELPKWPANEKPVAAKVIWDSHGLRIEAANSSLVQILQDVATATGMQVEGFETDQRIFGVYGPGPAREILSQLLVGSGYNVVMVGDLGEGTPREILLSSRHSETATATPNNTPASDDDSDSEDQPQPVGRPGFGPGQQPRVPQQMQQMPQRPMQGQPPQ